MRLLHLSSALVLTLIHLTATAAPAPGAAALSGVKTQADLTAAIAAATAPATKRALQTHSAAILAAAAKKPHVDFVVAALDKAPGTYTKTNTTPAELKAALGGEVALFDTVTVINLGSATLNIKAKREVDPFDEAFYQHLGSIPDVQMLTIIHTTAQNAWLASVSQLKGLTNLSIVNQSKLNDEGLAHLAGLKNLERFAYIGTSMTGKPFKDFTGWTKLRSSSFRGSQIDDLGLQYLCENFSNYETLSLAHAKFTDAAAVHLAKLKQLKGLEVGSQKATSQSLRHLVGLPLEYFQLGEGVDSPDSLSIIKEFKSLKRLTLTNCKTYTEADLKTVAGMKQLEHLELGNLPMTAERVAWLKRFAHLKSMRLVPPYPKELQASIQEALPKVAIRFE
jgi:hypothetical protein